MLSIFFLFLSFIFLNAFSDQAKSGKSNQNKNNKNVIELKGFKLGMTKKEFKKTWKSQRKKYHQNISSYLIPHYTTTLAGVSVDKPTIWWTNEKPKKVDTIQFRFFYNVSAVRPIPCSSVDACPNVIQPASNFVRVVEAIKQKYPGFKCTESGLMNKMGAKWTNRKCINHLADGVSISTIRYRNNKEWGTITILPTNIYKQGQKENQEEFKKDL